MTVILNIFFAALLLCTGVYHMWVGDFTEGLTMFTLILILHNAAGGYKAAMNTVVLFKLMDAIGEKINKISLRI